MATIGEVFPADDLLAQWIVTLAAVGEDLATADEHLRTAMADDNVPASQGIYHFRVATSRVYEARRPILALESSPALAAFAEGIATVAAPLSFLRSVYVPSTAGGRSVADELFAPTRNQTVHHSWPGSEEIRVALRNAADDPATIVMDYTTETLHFVFPEIIATRSLVGDLDDDEEVREAFAERVALAGEVTVQFTVLVVVAMGVYLEGRGFDFASLAQHWGEPPDGRG
jgi:hypothetical protein